MEHSMLKKVFLAMIIACFAYNTAKSEEVKMTTFQDSVAYAIGSQIGGNLKNDSLMFNLDMIKQGMYDALYTDAPKLSMEQMGAIMQKFQQELVAKQQATQQKAASTNLKKAEEFLTKNKSAEGVKTTASGLQYKVVTEGTGASPAATDTVVVHYEGKLLNGNVFDSSYERGEPIEFPLNRVIKGWTEGVQLMKEGGKYMFYIHPDLGYGERGAGQNIGPNELLIFTVELKQVKKASAVSPKGN